MGNQKMSVVAICLAVVFFITALASGTHIVGEQPASHANTRHQVQIRLLPYEAFIFGGIRCAGSLITTKTVLTAAHCVYFPGGYINTLIAPDLLLIVAGDLLLTETSSTSARRNVSKVIVHPAYNHNFRSDLSILILTQPFQKNLAIAPIALASFGSVLPDNTNCQVTGWGSLHYGNYPTSNQLMSMTVPIVDYERCNRSYDGHIAYDMICAGPLVRDGIDTCMGDSGAPLVCNDVLTGVLSFGFKCAFSGFPLIFANVGYERIWIDANIENVAVVNAGLSGPVMVVMLFVVTTFWDREAL